MDWSKIKTIFIITFLILDVYLLFQFMKMRDANKFELNTEASIVDKLKIDEITYIDLPKDPIKAQYLNAKPKLFTNSELAKLKGQTPVLSTTDSTITMTLEKPFQLSSKFEPAELNEFIKDNILFGEHYQFFKKDEKRNTITYYQYYEDYPLYQNISGMIIFHYNSDNQIVGYQQTYLEGIEKLASKEEVLSPLKGIETLYQKGILKPKSNITEVEFGYSTLVQLAASQVLAPTWRFVVDDKESLYVNAFEGKIIQFNGDEKDTNQEE